MKRYAVLIMVLIMVLTGCSGTGDDVEVLQGQIDALKSQISDLQAELALAAETIEESQANMMLVMAQADELAAANVALEEELITLTVQNSELVSSANQAPTVLGTAQTVVELLESQDFQGLAGYIHPTSGVRFTPYTYVDVMSDLVMTGPQIAAFATDITIYNWGSYDGIGDPIDATPMDYYAEFIYDHDFAAPELIGWNNTIGSGNMINNLADAYPSAEYVEFHFTGFDPQYSGMDWSSLTLVFEALNGDWYLVGVVHGQWTI